MKWKNTEKNWYMAWARGLMVMAVATGTLAGCVGAKPGNNTVAWQQTEGQEKDENRADGQEKQSDTKEKDSSIGEKPMHLWGLAAAVQKDRAVWAAETAG